jgi:non-ribosomal peptide synthetase component F
MVTLHHIVTDAWSTDLLLEELWQAYDADLRGEPDGLPELPVQYADYALWEQSGGAVADEDARYWQRHLAGAPEAIELDFDAPLPATPLFRSATLPYELSRAETTRLVDFCVREGITLYMAVLAAYLIVLHRRSGQSDLVVGSGTANRGRVELERVIGFFTNQVVVRTRVSGEDGVRALLGRVRETTLAAHSHDALPFDRLVELLRPPRRVNRPPLFHVEIEYHRRSDVLAGPAGVTVGSIELPNATTTLDLSLHVVQTESVLRGALVYNADVFAAVTARRMLGELRCLLAAVVATPEATVAEVAARAGREARATAARERAATARARFDVARAIPIHATSGS